MRGGGARASRRGWHAGVPDLALGCADAVESVEEARDVEGLLGVEQSLAKSASMSLPTTMVCFNKTSHSSWFTSKLEYKTVTIVRYEKTR